MSCTLIRATDRAVIRISGENNRQFLQSIVSNDVNLATQDHAVLAALLSPQGKFLADFFIIADKNDLLLETEQTLAETLVKKLSLYKLRAKITITLEETLKAAINLNDNEPPNIAEYNDIISFSDPRHQALGTRIIAKEETLNNYIKENHYTIDNSDAYEKRRIHHLVAEGSKDAVIDKTILLENRYDKIGGVSFTKGCYVGQEVTARSNYRGNLRKYLHKVTAEKDVTLPAKGTNIMAGDSIIGDIRSSHKNVGLALVRADKLARALAENLHIMVGDVQIKVTET